MKNSKQWLDHMMKNGLSASETIKAAQYEVIDYIAENAKRVFVLGDGVDVTVDKEYILGLKEHLKYLACYKCHFDLFFLRLKMKNQ